MAAMDKKWDLLDARVNGQSLEISQLRSELTKQAALLSEANGKIETLMHLLEQLEGHILFKERTKRSSPPLPPPVETISNSQAAPEPTSSAAQIHTQFRSCSEIFLAYEGGALSGVTLNRDKFNIFIDPDGQGIGDPPILVECYMDGKYIYFNF